ncbi:MAG: GAF domain-containing protein, partial [Anaerolineales bacterium]|nr:GAF domain-containing protein [Anaerolineales bacterium]
SGSPILDAAERVEYAVSAWSDISAIRQAERALEYERYLFETLMDNLPHYIYFKDKQSRFTRINRAQAHHLGVQEASEVIGKSDFDYYDAEFIRPVFEEEMRIIETGVPLVGKEEHEVFQNNRVLWEITTKMPLRALSGEIIGTFGISMDITERKQIELQVQRQNAYVNALQETSVGLIQRLDVNALLQDIVTRAGQLVGTENGYVFIKEPGADEMELRVGVGAYEGFVGRRTRSGVGLAGQIWESNAPVVVDDYRTWGGRLADASRDILRAVAGVPMRSGSEVIGVIGLAYLDENHLFGEQEIAVLERFAQLAAIALDNARLYEFAHKELAERTRAEANARQRNLELESL